ncbi:MAG: dienelactone hydrolase family protein [Acidimicrobiia bacterium]|nr:dienelactone hydrolase family protein [Acidimicrobiia bacterium]
MRTETINYAVDGNEHQGHLAIDEAVDGPRPAILVCHEGPGLGTHERDVCERLASLGYVAFALDYHGGGGRLSRAEAMARLADLRTDADRIRRLGRAGLDVLLDQAQADTNRVAAIGYCFGGTMALELGRAGVDLKAIVGFHSGLGTPRPDDAANISGSVLVNIGADDPIIPPDQRAEFEAEMRAGSVDWQMLLLGGVVHSFTNPDASKAEMPTVIAYDEAADRRSWAAMLGLFADTLG